MGMIAEAKANPFHSFFGSAPEVQELLLLGPHMQAAIMRAALNQQREICAFICRCCDEELKLADRIEAATSLGDLYWASVGLWEDVALQYATESGKIADASTHRTAEAFQSMQRQAHITATAPQKRQAA